MSTSNKSALVERPKIVEKPDWFGSYMNPATALANSGQSPNPVKTETARREVTLPPGLSTIEFYRAIEDLKGLIGAQHVTLNDGPLNDGNYFSVPLSHDAYSIHEKDFLIACAVVDPGSTADVQAIVRWANQWQVPLWPISIGRNIGYGGAAPRVPGSLVLNMGKRLNKVLNIDEKAATCLVQPGVTFVALYEEIQRRGLGDKLWIDVPDLGGGSVIGNTLERGIGYTPYGDHWSQHCGLEVVLPNGEVVRTGMDALPGSNVGQMFQYGFGPYHDGIFSQSNFGIVTRMGLWLMPNPGGSLAFMITFPLASDLAPIVDILRPMMLNRTLHNVPGLRMGLWDAATSGNSREHYWPGGVGATPDEVEQAIIDKEGVGHWNFYGCVYGPDSITGALWDNIKSQFKSIPGAKFYTHAEVPSTSYLHDRAKVFSGVPTWRELNDLNWIPNAGHLFFAPISAVSGEDAVKQSEMCKARCVEYGFDYLGIFYIGPREMHHIVTVLFDRSKPEERSRALKLMRVLIADAAKLGYGEYRTHNVLQDQVAATYNWNDGAIMKLNNTLKDALDPNGIMQPGRSGIWPRKYRGKGWELGLEMAVGKDRRDSKL